MKNISYAIPVAATVLGNSVEQAAAVEIPSNATYEYGIHLLHQAAKYESFETQAVYTEMPDGSARWYSHEGKENSVDMHKEHGGFEESLSRIVRLQNIPAGTTIDMEGFHVHPQKSAEKMHVTKQGKPASFPPSGAGFVYGKGDVGYELLVNTQEKAFEQIEKQSGIKIIWKNKVVDPLGVWTYSPRSSVDMKNDSESAYNVYLERETLLEEAEEISLQGRSSENAVKILERHDMAAKVNKKLKPRESHLYSIVRAWERFSQTSDIHVLRNSEIYGELVNAYKVLGVNVSYEPFTLSSK